MQTSVTPRIRKILFLAANPKGTPNLALDQEIKAIEAGLERSKYREQFDLELKWAVDVRDIRRAILEVEPQIVHFSGHGAGEQGLILQDERGQIQPLGTAGLAGLFKLLAEDGRPVDCVLLNACYSQVQAKAIAQYVPYVLGMTQAIGDAAAIEFAVGFYDALGTGKTVEFAFQYACTAIQMAKIPEHLTPVLIQQPTKLSMTSLSNNGFQAQKSPAHSRTMSSTSEEPWPNSEEKRTSPPASKSEVIELGNPEGQVPLRSIFYVERPPIEQDCYATIKKSGALIRVKAAQKMGKTSLMTRILHHADQRGYRAVPVDLRLAEGDVFTNLKQFLQWFCGTVTESLNLPDQTDSFWQRGALGNKVKCTNYFQQHLLTNINTPLVLGLDEVDVVFQHFNIAKDFFALLRVWHELGKNEPIWQNLRLIIVHSREIYIPLNMYESPFNVGLPIELPELTSVQVQELVQRHGLAWSGEQIDNLMVMLGGHPFLVQVALYEIARNRMNLKDLLQIAPTEEGPYYNHLRHHLKNLKANANLLAAIKQVLAVNRPVQIESDMAFQLRSMGLVKFQGNAVIPLCDLYRRYFCDRLVMHTCQQ